MLSTYLLTRVCSVPYIICTMYLSSTSKIHTYIVHRGIKTKQRRPPSTSSLFFHYLSFSTMANNGRLYARPVLSSISSPAVAAAAKEGGALRGRRRTWSRTTPATAGPAEPNPSDNVNDAGSLAGRAGRCRRLRRPGRSRRERLAERRLTVLIYFP